MNKQMISQTAGRRLVEVRERVGQLDPDRFGEMSEFVSSVRSALLDYPASNRESLPSLAAPEYWMDADGSCLDSLRQLSVGGMIMTQPGSELPSQPFLQKLQDAAKQRQTLFHLLVQRYSFALNFSLPAEEEVREFVLLRLMVADRARIENESVRALDADDLLLRLNLIAVHAAVATDLRFLDALNYYYELLPATWHPDAENEWLLASYLALYARALMS